MQQIYGKYIKVAKSDVLICNNYATYCYLAGDYKAAEEGYKKLIKIAESGKDTSRNPKSVIDGLVYGAKNNLEYIQGILQKPSLGSWRPSTPLASALAAQLNAVCSTTISANRAESVAGVVISGTAAMPQPPKAAVKQTIAQGN